MLCMFSLESGSLQTLDAYILANLLSYNGQMICLVLVGDLTHVRLAN